MGSIQWPTVQLKRRPFKSKHTLLEFRARKLAHFSFRHRVCCLGLQRLNDNHDLLSTSFQMYSFLRDCYSAQCRYPSAKGRKHKQTQAVEQSIAASAKSQAMACKPNVCLAWLIQTVNRIEGKDKASKRQTSMHLLFVFQISPQVSTSHRPFFMAFPGIRPTRMSQIHLLIWQI